MNCLLETHVFVLRSVVRHVVQHRMPDAVPGKSKNKAVTDSGLVRFSIPNPYCQGDDKTTSDFDAEFDDSAIEQLRVEDEVTVSQVESDWGEDLSEIDVHRTISSTLPVITKSLGHFNREFELMK
jgi:hypothetical protein